MTLNQLTHFMSVVQYSSITKAAGKLYISHSAISRSISELENEFKVMLFVRDGHRLILSEEGELLAKHCQIILDDIDRLNRDMMHISQNREKSLRISLPTLNPESDIISAISKFKSEHPDVSLVIEDLDLDSIEEELLTKKLDCAITYSFIIDKMKLSPYEFSSCNLFEENFSALLNKNAPEASLEYLDPLKVKMKQPLILKDAGLQFIESVAPTALFLEHTNPQHYAPISLNSIILSVINNTGWAILPDCVAQRFVHVCKVIPTLLEGSRHHVSICWRTDPKNPILNKFVKTIKSEF